MISFTWLKFNLQIMASSLISKKKCKKIKKQLKRLQEKVDLKSHAVLATN